MFELNPELRVVFKRKVEDVLRSLERERRSITKEHRKELEDRIKRLDPRLEEKNFLAADASSSKQEMRHFALWGVHLALVSASFDGGSHRNPLTGTEVPYSDLKYRLEIDFGVFLPYSRIDRRLELKRAVYELRSLLSLSAEEEADYLLFDGSLVALVSKFREDVEAEELCQLLEQLEQRKVVGMVEDSHSNEVARELGLRVTDSLLFETLLEEGEYYAYSPLRSFWVCWLKLPGKELRRGPAESLVVRWEFRNQDFEKDLNRLAAIWLAEPDASHPQLFPLRLCDYLTRRFKLSAFLDRLAADSGLAKRHREERFVG